MALSFYNWNRNETKQQSWIETEMKQNNKVESTICPNWHWVVKSDNNQSQGRGGSSSHNGFSPWDNVGIHNNGQDKKCSVKFPKNMMNLSQFIATVSEHSLRCGTKWKLPTSFIGVSPIQAKPITIIIRIIIIITEPKWPTQHTYVKILTKRQNHKTSRRVLELKSQVDN
jgi:hypothetical protein